MLSEEDRLRRKVEKRIEERNDFYTHLAIYVSVNLMLWVIYFLTSFPDSPWPIWPTMGWGIGIVAHGMSYYFEHGGGAARRVCSASKIHTAQT